MSVRVLIRAASALLGVLYLVVGIGSIAREEPSRSLHWLLTVHLLLDSAIHCVGPQGLVGSWPRGLINSIAPVVMVILGVLWRAPRRDARRTSS